MAEPLSPLPLPELAAIPPTLIVLWLGENLLADPELKGSLGCLTVALILLAAGAGVLSYNFVKNRIRQN